MTTSVETLTADRREEITRFVLRSPIETSSRIIGDELGLNRETIRRIRIGMVWPDVLPNIPRITSEQMKLRCNQCLHYIADRKYERIDGINTRTNGRCTLGIPEAKDIVFARGCGAFTHAEAQ